MGKRVASCRTASHWSYWNTSARPGPWRGMRGERGLCKGDSNFSPNQTLKKKIYIFIYCYRFVSVATVSFAKIKTPQLFESLQTMMIHAQACKHFSKDSGISGNPRLHSKWKLCFSWAAVCDASSHLTHWGGGGREIENREHHTPLLFLLSHTLETKALLHKRWSAALHVGHCSILKIIHQHPTEKSETESRVNKQFKS